MLVTLRVNGLTQSATKSLVFEAHQKIYNRGRTRKKPKESACTNTIEEGGIVSLFDPPLTGYIEQCTFMWPTSITRSILRPSEFVTLI